ncbi:transcriptional coactivator/pterin dehydratase [Clathrospora elynae]|uniref:4a-hydroxytetrahydrobiopterin dehydratase n=1 Tax=Clathrospora elynae TaxID=706981 RepID=A0A6A5T7H1_9PLEO|nr:transcriptional coactivator/pterin dehydratase [Clathrospora elynae]
MTAPLQRPTQVLPKSYRALCEHHCRTKTSLLIRREAHVQPRQPTSTPYCRYAPPIRFWPTLISRAPFSSAAGQPIRSRAADDIILAAGQPADLPDRVSILFPAWQPSESNKGIKRQFDFPSFAKAWKFMALVAEECKSQRHHPSWSNLYNQVTIEWTTHKPEGLSVKDVEMAEFCNRTANAIGLKN